jgi:uncharacterized repeat protein (TIGR01451 family)
MSRQRVPRWRVGLLATLALTAIGLLFASRTVLTAAAIPLAYVLYGAVSRVPADPALSVERSFDGHDPAPGEAVEVTVAVENAGERVLPDVRVVDGVPEALAVTDGSPRICTALPPGETARLTYTVVAKRGEHDFADPVVRLRSLAAAERLTEAVAADGERTLRCANTVADAPLREATLPRAGTLPTDTGGSGLEFFATRQYQTGDPMNRVDWRHYAKTGEFVTVQYREEQAIRTVLIVDARPVGRVTARPGYPTGAELAAYAGERLHETLDRAGVVTSVAAVGLDSEGRDNAALDSEGVGSETLDSEGRDNEALDSEGLDGLVGPDGVAWVDPETGGPAGRARAVFRAVQSVADSEAEPAATTPPDSVATDGGPDGRTRRLLARMPPTAQVVVCTPLLDNWPVALAKTLAVRGFPLMVVSPDVTGGGSIGQSLSGVHRRLRLRELERSGAKTVTWHRDQPIDAALRRSLPHLLTRR